LALAPPLPLEEHVLLGREVEVERPARDADRGDDAIDLGVGDALLPDLVEGRLVQALAGLRTLAVAPGANHLLLLHPARLTGLADARQSLFCIGASVCRTATAPDAERAPALPPGALSRLVGSRARSATGRDHRGDGEVVRRRARLLTLVEVPAH